MLNATTERGVSVLEGSQYLWAEDDSVAQYVRQVVARAELSGYLRTVTMKRRPGGVAAARTSSTLFGVRLHRRFAPFFMFSYRGAYEPVRVSAEYLALLCAADSDITPDAWVAGVAPPEAHGTEQLSLPLTADDDEV